MITGDFVQKTRARIAEMRAVLGKLRDAHKEAVRQLSKIGKQHTSDRTRVYDRLGQLADDVVEKLPEETPEAAVDEAYALQEQINDLAGDLDEVSLASSSIEDLTGTLADTCNEIYASLKEAEAQLSKVERGAAKLGV